jgi:hypothetical protein
MSSHHTRSSRKPKQADVEAPPAWTIDHTSAAASCLELAALPIQNEPTAMVAA